MERVVLLSLIILLLCSCGESSQEREEYLDQVREWHETWKSATELKFGEEWFDEGLEQMIGELALIEPSRGMYDEHQLYVTARRIELLVERHMYSLELTEQENQRRLERRFGFGNDENPDCEFVSGWGGQNDFRQGCLLHRLTHDLVGDIEFRWEHDLFKR